MRNGVIRRLIVATVARRWIAGEFRVLANGGYEELALSLAGQRQV
jgi:hypothetical protein